MPRIPLSRTLAAVALAGTAQAASLTPPNLTAATSLNGQDLLLVWPNASGGPLEAMQWSTFKAQVAAGLGGSFLQPSNNLSDVASPTAARANLGLGTAATANVATSGTGLGLLNTANSWSATQTFPGGSGTAPINLAPGTAPTSPNNGDCWTTTAGLFCQINGSAQQMAPVSSGTYAPTLSFVTPGTSSFSYTKHSGWYSKTGNECILSLSFIFVPTIGTGSGVLQISLPSGISPIPSLFGFGNVQVYGGGFSGVTGEMLSSPAVSGVQIEYNNGNQSVSTSNMSSGITYTFDTTVTFNC